MRFYCELRTQRTCPVKVKMKKKRMGTRDEMIKVKVKHLRDLVRPEILKEVVLVPALLVEV